MFKLDSFYLIKEKKSPYYIIIHVKPNGKRVKRSTKRKLKSEALKVLSDYKEIFLQTKIKSVTLSMFADQYCNYIKDTFSQSYLNKSVKPSFKFFREYLQNDLELSEITDRQAEAFINNYYQKSEYASRLYFRTLKAAFNIAKRWGYIQTNPFQSIKLPKVKKSFPVFVSLQDLAQIIKVINNQTLRDIVLVAFYSGMRLGEILNMKCSWINFDNRFVITKIDSSFCTKSKCERTIPLHSSIIQILEKYTNNKSANDFVFQKFPGVKLSGDWVSKSFKKAVLRSGVNEKLHFHNLRSGFATTLIDSNIPLPQVQRLLGHQNISTTMCYVGVQNQNLTEAVEQIKTNIYSNN